MSRGKSRIAKAESKTQFIREISGGRNFIYRPPKSSQIVSMAKKGKRESKTKVLILTSTQNLIKLWSNDNIKMRNAVAILTFSTHKIFSPPTNATT